MAGSDCGVGRVVYTELHKEATEAYMAYAMSVLLGRALLDVRDGLKPVHRRTIFAMNELALASQKPFKKCARIVREVLGKFHPHGDTAVYDALVRMAQDFSLRCPLIQGHGNFGSIDVVPPAAMRRLSELLGGSAIKFDLSRRRKDEEVNLLGDGTEKPEFGDWVKPDELIEHAVEFKQSVYKQVSSVFAPHFQRIDSEAVMFKDK